MQEAIKSYLDGTTLGQLQKNITFWQAGTFAENIGKVEYLDMFNTYAHRIISVCGDQDTLRYNSEGSLVDVLDAMLRECKNLRDVFKCSAMYKRICDTCIPPFFI